MHHNVAILGSWVLTAEQLNSNQGIKVQRPYLIFVANATNGVGVKILK